MRRNKLSLTAAAKAAKTDPVWYAGRDVVASILRTGKVPKMIRAIRIVPEGRQKGMKPVRLRGKVVIDPRQQDFFQSVIEARASIKNDNSLEKGEREALA